MRFLFLLLLPFLMSTNSFSQYMTKEEIFNDLNQVEKIAEEPLSKEGLQREANLIPEKEFRKDLPSIAKSLVEPDLKSFPDSVDLRKNDSPVKSQDNGKCTIFSLIGAIEQILKRDGLDSSPDLSEWHGWSYYKTYSSVASFKALSNPLNRVGDEGGFPQYGKKNSTLFPYVYLKGSDFIGGSVNRMVEAISKGNPVVIAMKLPKEVLSCKSKVISTSTGFSSGGHAILISGYNKDSKGNVVATIKNSWGDKCHDKGYFYFPMSVCKKAGMYCDMWVVESVDTLKKPGSVSNLPLPEPEKFKEVCSRSWRNLWRKKCELVSI